MFLWIFILVGITNNIIGNMIRDSIADIADEVELLTDKRQEGVLFAALGFTKVNTGFGTAIAGFVLSIIGFTSQILQIIRFSFNINQGGLVPIMLLIPIAIFYFYNLDRDKYRLIQKELNLKKS